MRVVQEVGWTGVPVRAAGAAGKPGLPRRAYEVHGDGRPQDTGSSCTLPASSAGEWSWSSRRLQREYVWAMDPGGYVDELAAQFVYTESNTRATPSDAELGDDTSATLLSALTDHTATLNALTDSQGHVAAQ